MNKKVEELIENKIYKLRCKGFDNIEMLNRNVFKATKYRESYKIKLTDTGMLYLNGECYGLI